MSDSVRPHRQQPTRLPRPWDSPGKNTGVGCHFLLQCMKVKSESEVAQSCLTLSDSMDCSLPGSSIHGIFQARVLEWGAIAFSAREVWFLAILCLIRTKYIKQVRDTCLQGSEEAHQHVHRVNTAVALGEESYHQRSPSVGIPGRRHLSLSPKFLVSDALSPFL